MSVQAANQNVVIGGDHSYKVPKELREHQNWEGFTDVKTIEENLRAGKYAWAYAKTAEAKPNEYVIYRAKTDAKGELFVQKAVFYSDKTSGQWMWLHFNDTNVKGDLQKITNYIVNHP